jgi:hypothetical protein
MTPRRVAGDGDPHASACAGRCVRVQVLDGGDERRPVEGGEGCGAEGRPLDEDAEVRERRGREGVEQRGEGAQDGVVVAVFVAVDADGQALQLCAQGVAPDPPVCGGTS